MIARVPAGNATGTGWTYGPAAVGDFPAECPAPPVGGHDALDDPATGTTARAAASGRCTGAT